jgi:hypothetical protein
MLQNLNTWSCFAFAHLSLIWRYSSRRLLMWKWGGGGSGGVGAIFSPFCLCMCKAAPHHTPHGRWRKSYKLFTVTVTISKETFIEFVCFKIVDSPINILRYF